MPYSTELDGDLAQLQIKYSIDSDFIRALAKSPRSAQESIRAYKVLLYMLCTLCILLGLCLILYSFLSTNQYVGIGSGMVGAVMVYHFLNDFFKMRKAVKEIERVARYHHLL